ncbi:MAG: hypothetical protein LBM59_01495 [Ruminococcus sp.]|jgi:hypothetical protein|nr:hypothetical protein [Ruminococcus sp.]
MKKTILYILLQILAAGVIFVFFNVAERFPLLLYPLSVIIFGGIFYISVKTVKTILNTRTVFAVLFETLISLQLFAQSSFSNGLFIFFLIAVLAVLIAEIVLFIRFREFSLKHIVRNVLITLLFKGAMIFFAAVVSNNLSFDIDSYTAIQIFGSFVIILFLSAFFFLKTDNKSPADVNYTASDAIVFFIGTTSVVADTILGLMGAFIIVPLF